MGDNGVSLGLLKNLVDYLDNVYKDLEFYYSYPYEGKYSTPVPCLIVQNKSTLDAARREYKKKLTEWIMEWLALILLTVAVGYIIRKHKPTWWNKLLFWK